MNTSTRMDRPLAETEQAPTVMPPVDVLENQDEIVLIADLPGIRQDDVAIHIDKDQLLLEAKRAVPTPKGSTLLTEYRPASYRRKFAITQGSIDVDKVKADLSNGVLTVTLPKAARVKPRVIKVTSG